MYDLFRMTQCMARDRTEDGTGERRCGRQCEKTPQRQNASSVCPQRVLRRVTHAGLTFLRLFETKRINLKKISVSRKKTLHFLVEQHQID